MRMSFHIQRRSGWAAALLLALGAVVCSPAALANAKCDGLPNTLPMVDVTTYDSLIDYPDLPPKKPRLVVDYRLWEDYCYGTLSDGSGRVDWQEWVDVNIWKSGKAVLTRRLDYYRPADKDLSEVTPLVIFAHPGGIDENFDRTPGLFHWVVMTLLKQGYSVASIESRHPLSSFVVNRFPDSEKCDRSYWPPVSTKAIPSDDIATAVRWMKFNKATFGIDAFKILLVGQSRGSAVLLNALLDEQPVDGATDWKSKSSTVQGVYAYQAQTTYVESELALTFVKEHGPNDGELYRYWFYQDTPDLIPGPDPNVLPGSAVQLARNITDKKLLIPVHLSHEQALTLLPDGVTIKKQCYESNNQNRECQQFDNDDNALTEPPIYAIRDLPRCPAVNGMKPREMFDIHDPNYGQYFAQAYSDQLVPNRVTRCVSVGKDDLEGGYSDLVGFAASLFSNTPFTPKCEPNGVVVPSPPPRASLR
jgi:hypothetical protein